MAELHEALAVRGRAALSGLGGVGKTQTAVEYAHRHFEEYDHVFLVSAASREGLLSGYVTIAGLLKLPEAGAQDQTLAVRAVKRWLGYQQRWLLILDNADDLAVSREFIPPPSNGHVLLTTRGWATGAIARRVEIQEMRTDEAALFLLRRAKYIAENATLDAAAAADQEKAIEIATQLDGLPLALDQAGAYIEETACGVSGYFDLYRNHAVDLLRLRGTLDTGHPDPVVSTWALSFENIQKTNLAAAELLKFCAFLHPDAIPEEVLREGASELGSVLGVVASDELALNHAISEILRYSLVRRDPSAATLEIHRLVQAVLKQELDENTQRLWAERAVRAVDHTFPNPEVSNWYVCDRLLPQAQACTQLINQWGFEFPEAAELLNDVGLYLSERGRYTEAIDPYQRTLAIRKKALGPEHRDTLRTRAEIARWTGEPCACTRNYCRFKSGYSGWRITIRCAPATILLIGPDTQAIHSRLSACTRNCCRSKSGSSGWSTRIRYALELRSHVGPRRSGIHAGLYSYWKNCCPFWSGC